MSTRNSFVRSPHFIGSSSLFLFVFVVPNLVLPPSFWNSLTGNKSEVSVAGNWDQTQEKTASSKEQEKPKLDPTKHQPLFKDWKKPELLLYISGRLHGYIEPCGCAGLDQMKGGLMRRHRSISDLEKKGWPVVKLDLGDQVRRTGPQPMIKLDTSYKALTSVMKYDAIGMGPGELQNDPFAVLGLISDNQPQPPKDQPDKEMTSTFVSANVSLYEDSDFIRPFRVIEKNKYKIFVTSVVGKEELPGGKEFLDKDENVGYKEPAKAIEELLPQMAKGQYDLKVLLAFVSEEESRKLARKFPQFNIIVNKGVEGEPVDKLEYIKSGGDNGVLIMQMGYKGMYTGAIGYFNDKKNPVRYQRIPMDHRFKDTPEIKDLFLGYQNRLKDEGLKALIGNPVRHPSGNKYVGSDACQDCHDEEFDIWRHGTEAWKKAHPGKPGPHYRATLDLTDPGERTWVKRHHDPECLSCHVTGWNAQQFFAYKSGYFVHEKDTALHTSGCENCHGPGSHHVALENGDIDGDDKAMEKARKDLRVTKAQARDRLCNTCHDLNNSPDFDFDKYWPMVEHGGSSE